jgi:hypothetical protein
MRVDSLKRLEVVFDGWRSRKQHIRERVPEDLMARARRASAVHGVGAVARAAAIDCRRLADATGSESRRARRRPARRSGNAGSGRSKRGSGRSGQNSATPTPAYSRIAFHASGPSAGPLAEVETAAGLNIRIFKVNAETVSLLSALNGPGRAL